MTRLIRPVVGLVLLGAALAGCSLFFDSPTVRIVDVRVTGIGLTSATAEVGVDIENPNGFSLTSTGLEYRLAFEDQGSTSDQGTGWHVVVEGEADEVVRVEGNDRSRVTIRVPFRYEDLGRAVLGLLERGELRYRLTGEVNFDTPVGEIGVPFEDIGEIGL